MTLDPEDIVWAFDGSEGRGEGLSAMIGIYTMHLTTLLPDASDDPFEQIVADLADDPTNRMLGNPRLGRLYPPALEDSKGADEFWKDSIHSLTRSRLEAAETVRRSLDDWDGPVPVTLGAVDSWAKTLGGMRLFWYSELAGTDRMADVVVTEENESLVDLVEWLGYLLEDLMESRETCLNLVASLDPDQFQPSERDD
ncbi:DUF2017 family protein [Tessaracoccus flavus]|uniref:Uncharacterized protein n=1 Tax=Tessaracoccus flavus TaxID=1610493 RepID=A0A1Q2CFU1_9ACTN|nr:DUF2017 family protein [Tessaracoccus flavus]AQP44992.1 hypothetical protein RPIT_09510 [Tessaracoccus flavus]SDY59858.1 protein of unknown function [Tessaracoccus flavus]